MRQFEESRQERAAGHRRSPRATGRVPPARRGFALEHPPGGGRNRRALPPQGDVRRADRRPGQPARSAPAAAGRAGGRDPEDPRPNPQAGREDPRRRPGRQRGPPRAQHAWPTGSARITASSWPSWSTSRATRSSTSGRRCSRRSRSCGRRSTTSATSTSKPSTSWNSSKRRHKTLADQYHDLVDGQGVAGKDHRQDQHRQPAAVLRDAGDRQGAFPDAVPRPVRRRAGRHRAGGERRHSRQRHRDRRPAARQGAAEHFAA